jgi:hypothetical protein
VGIQQEETDNERITRNVNELLTNVVLGSWLSVPISLVAAVGFAGLWFLLPLRIRQRVED